MFWSTTGVGAKIKRASLDGAHHKGIYNLQRYSTPSAMTIDYENGSLFWIDSRWSRLESVDLNGK